MKKGILLIASLFFICSAFAFDSGSMLIGGQAGFEFSKANSDDDGTTDLYIFPQVGYFINPNICIDGILKAEFMNSESMDVNAFGIGAGARYFFDKLYAGADMQYEMANINNALTDTEKTESALYGTLKAGFLYMVLPGAYIDAQAHYVMGLGDYGGDLSGKNEQSAIAFLLGLQFELGR